MSFGFNNALTCKRGRGREEGGGGGFNHCLQWPVCVLGLDLFEMLLNTKGVPGMIERGITH